MSSPSCFVLGRQNFPLAHKEIMAFEMTQCQGFNLTNDFPDQIIVVGVSDPNIH